MSLSLCLTPSISYPSTRIRKVPIFNPIKPTNFATRKFSNLKKPIIRSVHENSEPASTIQAKPRWENILSTAASLYPVYVTVGGIVACLRPSSFSWFVEKGPASYSLTLGFIMLAMGLTLELQDLINLFMQKPFAVSFWFWMLFLLFMG